MWYTHTHNGILLNHKKEWNFALCNDIDGLGWYYAKWNKSDKDKYCMITHMWNLKSKTSECNKKEIDSQI